MEFLCTAVDTHDGRLRNAFSDRVLLRPMLSVCKILPKLFRNTAYISTKTETCKRKRELNLIGWKLKSFSKATSYTGVTQCAIHLQTRRVAVLRLHCVKITMKIGMEAPAHIVVIKRILFLSVQKTNKTKPFLLSNQLPDNENTLFLYFFIVH